MCLDEYTGYFFILMSIYSMTTQTDEISDLSPFNYTLQCKHDLLTLLWVT